MTERIGAIVLAGGRSSRFGRDKLAEPIEGRPLLDHAIEAVQAVATDIVVVVAPGVTPGLAPGVRIANDTAAFEGPLAGLAVGLAALDPSIDRAVVVAGDMPTLVPAVLSCLIAAIDPSSDVAILAVATGPVPLPMAVRPAAAGVAVRALLANGERRLRALPDAVPTCVIPEATWRLDDPAGRTLRDVDTPSDLE